MAEEQVQSEEHRITGERLVDAVKELVHQGNIRRIIVKNEQGQTLIEVPLALGVVGAFLAPVWVALGAIGALAAQYRVVVEKVKEG